MKTTTLYYLTIALLGLFAGGCITIMFIIVPFWFTLAPENLMQWFTDFGARTGITMLPMQIIPLILSVVAFFRAKKDHPESKKMWVVVNLSNFLILVSFFAYFLPVNISFAEHSVAAGDVNSRLEQWQLMHIARTVLSVISAAVAVYIAVLQNRQTLKNTVK